MLNRIFKVHILFATLLISFLVTCYENPVRDNPNDPDNWTIVYPENSIYGENLLRNSPITIDINNYFSLNVIIDGYSTVRVEVPYNSSFNWYYIFMPDQVIGWLITSESNKDIFEADGTGDYNCKIYFSGPTSGGYGKINIYEDNSDIPTRVKVISW